MVKNSFGTVSIDVDFKLIKRSVGVSCLCMIQLKIKKKELKSFFPLDIHFYCVTNNNKINKFTGCSKMDRRYPDEAPNVYKWGDLRGSTTEAKAPTAIS